MMRLLHTVPYLIPEAGGPARSVPNLCTALAQQGHQVDLVSCDYGDQFARPLLPPTSVKTQLVPIGLRLGLGSLWEPQLNRRLTTTVAEQGVQLIHNHVLWLPFNYVSVRAARRNNLPHIISTRGMVSRWAMSQSRLKKQLAWRLFQNRDLQTAAFLHTTSEDEAQAVRDLGLKSPVAIIPNGVNVPEQAATPQRAPNHKRRILFLSRIHPKKGLINLVRAAAQLPKDVDWEIVIAGPSEDGYQQVVEAEVAALGLQDRFVFLGMVADQDKWAVYKSADLFILPTHNENFGIVVAEALASGIPAITTKGAPWQELEQHRCGWWVDITVDALATALQQSLSLSNQELAEMGARGRNLIINQYSWQHIATKMTQAYEWVLGQQTTLPDCIHLA